MGDIVPPDSDERPTRHNVLDELRTTDDDDRVRTRASWAIAEIERHADRNPHQ